MTSNLSAKELKRHSVICNSSSVFLLYFNAFRAASFPQVDEVKNPNSKGSSGTNFAVDSDNVSVVRVSYTFATHRGVSGITGNDICKEICYKMPLKSHFRKILKIKGFTGIRNLTFL